MGASIYARRCVRTLAGLCTDVCAGRHADMHADMRAGVRAYVCAYVMGVEMTSAQGHATTSRISACLFIIIFGSVSMKGSRRSGATYGAIYTGHAD